MTNYQLAQLLDVEHNFAFAPREGASFCNCYASVFCAARGATLPPLKANEQMGWLAASQDWVSVGPAEAVTRVNALELVLAIAQALPHGHIAPLVESPDEDPMSAYVSAAGAHNYVRCKLERSFGPLKPTFFLWRK